MLFNSQEFIFAFLPVTILATAGAWHLVGKRAAITTLTLASLFFYAWWEVSGIFVMLASISFNYAVALGITKSPDGRIRRMILAVGVTGNLFALGWFKYSGFVLDNLSALSGHHLGTVQAALPLAISFYTFQQIAFIVDTYRGQMNAVPLRGYLISVVFFPHLIAGPLLHYRDIIGQFDRKFSVDLDTIGRGLPIFAIGLAKKVAIADPIAQFVSPLFAKAPLGQLEFFEAWAAALGYTAQLYFDFSGYSDMAIGIALMFGIVLPLNFNSPYKATSIIDFWRRWHITLSSFLRDYLYIPLGGSKGGRVRRHINLMIVMLLGGLWHGAGWTFVFWGAIHGLCLVVNHLWRDYVAPWLGALNRLLTPLYAVMTFGIVVVAWVFFRATTFGAALNILGGMFKPATVSLPGEASLLLGVDHLTGFTWGKGMSFPDFSAFWTIVIVSFAIIWAAPNTDQILQINREGNHERANRISWIIRATGTSVLLWITGFSIFGAAPSEFLYFQF